MDNGHKDVSRYDSQVQNRLAAEETGEESLREVMAHVKDVPGFQLNESGGPLGEEFDE